MKVFLGKTDDILVDVRLRDFLWQAIGPTLRSFHCLFAIKLSAATKRVHEKTSD